MLARRGAASLLIEAPWAQGEAWGRTMGEPEHDRQEHTQTVIDLRRAIDLVTAQPEVDAKRIGYVGHSFGALFGGILAGVEKRIKAFVLLAGVGSFTDIAAVNIPTLNAMALEAYSQGLAPIDPIHYIGQAAPSALFFQLARQDMFPSDKLVTYAEAGSEPKRVAWYDADHYSVNDAGRSDRMKWLQTELDLSD
jgi:dienelactone hydrolase